MKSLFTYRLLFHHHSRVVEEQKIIQEQIVLEYALF